MLFVTLAGGKRVQAQPDQTIDLLAGVRIWDIDADAAAFGTPFAASRSVSLADPVIGLRFNRQHTNGVSTIAYGDIGGFGIGPDFTAQIAVTVNYAITEMPMRRAAIAMSIWTMKDAARCSISVSADRCSALHGGWCKRPQGAMQVVPDWR